MLFKIRRWVRLTTEALLSLIFIAALMIMFEVWYSLLQIRRMYNRANPIELQDEIRKSRGR